jgi:hypothetical protein
VLGGGWGESMCVWGRRCGRGGRRNEEMKRDRQDTERNTHTHNTPQHLPHPHTHTHTREERRDRPHT